MSGAGPGKVPNSFNYKCAASLKAGQGRIRHRAAHHPPGEHDQAADNGADKQNHGQEDDGWQHRLRRAGRVWILMQMAAEDDDSAPNFGAVGKGNVAAEDQNIAGDRSAEKNISGENPHAACGPPLNIRRAEKAAGIVEPLLHRQQNVVAKVDYVR
jgi:hypothetical protein